MPVPATTGQLRTKVSDMQIGDYISCNYVASSGAVGAFSNFGGIAGTEIPVTGSATPNGSFYLVKIDKGLLCSDRVVQSGITWDALNIGKLIQGLPSLYADLQNLEPTLSEASPLVVASVEYAPAPAWRMFDNTSAHYDSNTTSNGNVVIDLSSVQTIKAIKMTALAGYRGGTGSIAFYGSTDKVNWTLIQSALGTNFTSDTYIYEFPNEINARYVKMTFTSEIWISEMEILNYSYKITVRSLTGGVAYADADGNPVLTDQNKGSFPTNNEWDRYIVNFPASKIQAGKTLNDVWHFGTSTTNIGTLCQDTIMNGISNGANTTNNDRRTNRGFSSYNSLHLPASKTSLATIGFRPVFEYREV